MSGKTISFVLDGEEYEMPEEEGLREMEELGRMGIPVQAKSFPSMNPATSPDAPSITSTVGAAPLLSPATQPDAPPDGAVSYQPPSFSDAISALADGGLQKAFSTSIGATPSDAGMAMFMGGRNAATFGLDKKIPGGYGDWVSELDARSKEAAPGVYEAADAVASTVNPATLTRLPKMGGVIGNAVDAAGQGALREWSDPEATGDDILNAAKGDALTAGAAHTGLKAVAGAGKWLNDTATRYGDINRVAATGVYGADMRNKAQNFGEDHIRQLGQRIEELGLHKADPESSNWNPINWLPQPASTYGRNARELGEDAAGRMQEAEQYINAMPNKPMVDTGAIAAEQDQRAAALYQLADQAAARPELDFRHAQAQGLVDKSQPTSPPLGAGGWFQPGGSAMPFPQALANRRAYDEQIDWARKGGAPESPMNEKVRREIAGGLRQGLDDSLDEAVAQGTLPERIPELWRGGRDDYAVAASVLNPAFAREYQEYGNQALSLPAMSFAAGAGDPATAALQLTAGQLMKSRGRSALAGGSRFLSNVGAMGQLPAELGRDANATGALTASALDGYSERRRAQDESRGYNLSSQLERQLQTDPSVFGEHAQELAAAETPMQREAVAERLRAQDEDFALLLQQLRSQP